MRITKKKLTRAFLMMDERLKYWIKLIRRFDKKFNNPPKTYEITKIDFKKKDDKIWEASYETKDGQSMIISGDYFYCIKMMTFINQLGYYIEDSDKKEKEN